LDELQNGMAGGMAQEMKTCPMMQMQAQQPPAHEQHH